MVFFNMCVLFVSMSKTNFHCSAMDNKVLSDSDSDSDSVQLQQTPLPTPPQSDVGIARQEPTSDLTSRHPANGSTTSRLQDMVKGLVVCSTCNKTFNRAVICHLYHIQLNRPVQCACGCVICTICYRDQGGCRAHNVSSIGGGGGIINSTASILASSPDMEKLGDWDLELNVDDHFKTDGEVNRDVRRIMTEEQVLDLEKLHTGRFVSLISIM